MKLNKTEQEIENLYEAGNIVTAKPRKAVLKKLATAASRGALSDPHLGTDSSVSGGGFDPEGMTI